MEKTKLELVVGVFVFVGLLCLAYLSLKLGKLEMIGGDVYEACSHCHQQYMDAIKNANK